MFDNWAMRVLIVVCIELSMINKNSGQGSYCLINPSQYCCRAAKYRQIDLENSFGVSIDNLSCTGNNRTMKLSVTILKQSEFFRSTKIQVQVFPKDEYDPVFTDYFNKTSHTREYQLKSNKTKFYLRVCRNGCSCILYREDFNFSPCKVTERAPVLSHSFLFTTLNPKTLPAEDNSIKNYWYVFFIPCIFIITGLTFFCLLLYNRKHKQTKKLRLSSEPQNCKVSYIITSNSNVEKTEINSTLSQRLQKMQTEVSKQVKLFIAFTNDHAMHQNIVINFVNFLQADLGFQVYCELFSDQEISLDPVAWVEKCLTIADKVLILWSPGGVQKWNNENVDDNIKNDLFTPVLRRVRNDIFHNVNVGKYCFGYFDYCTKASIPEVFAEPRVYHFKLMKQFDDLYFRLKGIERYLPGCVLKIDEVTHDGYCNRDITQYRSALNDSINVMNKYVVNHPQWHIEEVLNGTQMPTVDHFPEEYSIRQLHISIMPPIPIQNISETFVGNTRNYFNKHDQKAAPSKNSHHTQIRENEHEQTNLSTQETFTHTNSTENSFVTIDEQLKNKKNDVNANFITSEISDSSVFTSGDAIDSQSIRSEKRFESVNRAATNTDSFLERYSSSSKSLNSLHLQTDVPNAMKFDSEELLQTEYQEPILKPQFSAIQRLQTIELQTTAFGRNVLPNSCEDQPSVKMQPLSSAEKKKIVLIPVDQNEEPMTSLMCINNLSMAQ